MSGNITFYSRVDDIDSFAGKGIHYKVDNYESELIVASHSRFMSSQLHRLQEHRY